MKNLNVNAMGLQEMSRSEMVETEGGHPAIVFLAVAALVAWGAMYVAAIRHHYNM